MRRPAVVVYWVFPGHALEFPIYKPDLFGGGGHALEVVNTRVRDERLKLKSRIVIMSQYPIDHVSAITCPRRAYTRFIHKWFLNDLGYAVHNVDVGFSAP